MKRKIIITVVILAVVFLSLAGIKTLQIMNAMAEGAKQAPPPPSITTVVASKSRWVDTISAVGSIAPVNGVTLSAEESGKVAKINFDSGALVKKGDTLIELDTAVEEAQLASAEAQSSLAKVEYRRAVELRPRGAMSEAEFNKAEAQVKKTEADANALRATIARKKAIAPFDGRIGIRMVNVGQFVNQGTPLLPLHALDKLFVNFSVPQQDLFALAVGQKVKVFVDAYPQDTFEGTLTAINPQVDDNTRNVGIQATLPNDKERLRAGMFARVEVELPSNNEYLTLPLTAVSYAPYGNSVFVVEQTKDAEGKEMLGLRQQFIKLGAKRGDQVAILEGLKDGEQVASSGLFKLRPGQPVRINNNFATGNDPNPTPENT